MGYGDWPYGAVVSRFRGFGISLARVGHQAPGLMPIRADSRDDHAACPKMTRLHRLRFVPVGSCGPIIRMTLHAARNVASGSSGHTWVGVKGSQDNAMPTNSADRALLLSSSAHWFFHGSAFEEQFLWFLETESRQLLVSIHASRNPQSSAVENIPRLSS